MRALWLMLHLAGVVVWVGGMFFAHFCLRPSLAVLEAPARLALMSRTLQRFLRFVDVALLLIWVSGIARFAQAGWSNAPLGWHAMLAIGVVMTIVFVVIRAHHFPRLTASLAAGEAGRAAAALASIRRLVALNLALGALAVAAATFGGALA